MDTTILDEKKCRLDAARPLPQHTLRSLRDDLIVRWTYHSNAIEGNTLTLSETKVVLEGMTVGGRTMREHLEVINHRDAMDYLEELAKAGGPLTEWQIRGLHRLVLKGIDDENAGNYRHVNVLISGATHHPPEHFLVLERMNAMMAQYCGPWQALHPVERAAMLHGEFVKIHPFVDGNGRTGRLLMNLELVKSGYPAAVIPVEARPRYYDALDLAHTAGDWGPFLGLVTECAGQALDLWLSVL